MGDLAVHEPDHKRLIAFLKAMEFSSLTRRVAEFSGVEASEIEPDAKLKVGGAVSAPPPHAEEDEAPSVAAAGKPAAKSAAPSASGATKPNGALTPKMLAAA